MIIVNNDEKYVRINQNQGYEIGLCSRFFIRDNKITGTSDSQTAYQTGVTSDFFWTDVPYRWTVPALYMVEPVIVFLFDNMILNDLE